MFYNSIPYPAKKYSYSAKNNTYHQKHPTEGVLLIGGGIKTMTAFVLYFVSDFTKMFMEGQV